MSSHVQRQRRMIRFKQKLRHMYRQVRLLKQYGIETDLTKHSYHKVKSLNCGDPRCAMCGNPRKFFGERTIQEYRNLVDKPLFVYNIYD